MPTLQAIISILVIFSLLFYWTIAFLLLYHLTRFGVGVQPKRFAALFLFGSLSLFSLSVTAYINLDISNISFLS